MNDPKGKRMLAVFAHPDDESFAAGGTLAKYARRGVRVVLLCATSGEAGIAGMQPEAAGKVRESELRKAAEELGIEVRFLGCRDGGLAQCRLEMLAESMGWWMDLIRPQVVLTSGPEGISGHPDHATVSKAVTLAYDRYYKEGILLYIRPSEATVRGSGISAAGTGDGKPAVREDISGHITEKARAIRAYASRNPGPAGKLEEEAEKIPGFEWFTLARDNPSPEADSSWFEGGAGGS